MSEVPLFTPRKDRPKVVITDFDFGDVSVEREILEAYPDLEPEDVREALRYAAEAVRAQAPDWSL